jgi:hypothetical protein
LVEKTITLAVEAVHDFAQDPVDFPRGDTKTISMSCLNSVSVICETS